MIGIFGLQPPRDVFPPVKAAAERALALDESLAEGHTAGRRASRAPERRERSSSGGPVSARARWIGRFRRK
jgi:hypothetical protein